MVSAEHTGELHRIQTHIVSNHCSRYRAIWKHCMYLCLLLSPYPYLRPAKFHCSGILWNHFQIGFPWAVEIEVQSMSLPPLLPQGSSTFIHGCIMSAVLLAGAYRYMFSSAPPNRCPRLASAWFYSRFLCMWSHCWRTHFNMDIPIPRGKSFTR